MRGAGLINFSVAVAAVAVGLLQLILNTVWMPLTQQRQTKRFDFIADMKLTWNEREENEQKREQNVN